MVLNHQDRLYERAAGEGIRNPPRFRRIASPFGLTRSFLVDEGVDLWPRRIWR